LMAAAEALELASLERLDTLHRQAGEVPHRGAG
jgi:hypothetical protein